MTIRPKNVTAASVVQVEVKYGSAIIYLKTSDDFILDKVSKYE